MGKTAYLNFEDFVAAAAVSLGMDSSIVRRIADRSLSESALAAPRAGFGEHEQYRDFSVKAAVLLQHLATNHPLPDGNKRTALLCTILFANVNGLEWQPPVADEPDGSETAEVVEAAAAGHLPMAALAAWIDDRLVERPPVLSSQATERPPLTLYPAEYVGALHYENDTVQVGQVEVHDVHGYNPAAVYVRRVSGKAEGISVAEIIISVVGDGYAQEELDAENAEAERYPLGMKEYWRARLVGKATYGADQHPMTDDEFEAEWHESESS